jgi:hypothetical protein
VKVFVYEDLFGCVDVVSWVVWASLDHIYTIDHFCCIRKKKLQLILVCHKCMAIKDLRKPGRRNPLAINDL